MLISYGHGKRVVMHSTVYDSQKGYHVDCVPASMVCHQPTVEYVTADDGPPDAPPQNTPDTAHQDVFRYLVSDAKLVDPISDAAKKLDALAAAMAETSADENDLLGESNLAPILTYFGQFIDHDITANTDREVDPEMFDRFNIDKEEINPQDRSDVQANKGNLRKGNLGLDSVYGDGPGQPALVAKLEAAMRDKDDPAKMRIGQLSPLPAGIPLAEAQFPADGGADLLRAGALIDDNTITMQEARDLFDDPSDPKSEEAIRLSPVIGDGRNDENLIIAQFHLAILRFHNAVVDEIRSAPDTPSSNAEVFDLARKQVTWTYQWLVTNTFLKQICDPDIVDEIVNDRAPIYQDFFDAHQSANNNIRPMPLEFSVATFRYGHSMVRGEYDFNENFGRAADGSDGTTLPRADFNFLFAFTGGGGMRPNPSSQGSPTLPANWVINWERFTGQTNLSNRVARKIDTRLAPPLEAMPNANPGLSRIMNHLAKRNLRRGYVFNLPDAQSMHAGLEAAGANLGKPLTAKELSSGATGDAVKAGGFEKSTPLWFYTLKEAEIRGEGERLGPLGSRIVAETIVGLMVTDPTSYLFAGDSGFNTWTPDDGVKPFGQSVDTLPAMLRAAGVMGAGTTS